MEFDQTCWQGMRIRHPAEWELSKACAPDEPGQCCFSDRLYQRLDVRWTQLKHAPNLEAMRKKELDRRQKRKDETELSELTGAPEPWVGVVREGNEATVVNAARAFREQRMLVESVLVWPNRRVRSVENEVLASIQPQPHSAPTLRWEAMGLRAEVPSEFELIRSGAPVGRVRWIFSQPGKNPPRLVLERIAMPDTWLKKPLRDWLAEDLPDGHKPRRQDPHTVNGHRGQRIVSHRKLSFAMSLRGIRDVRTSIAWLCPLEDRLYRISYSRATREEETAIPGRVEVACCRPTPVAGVSGP